MYKPVPGETQNWLLQFSLFSPSEIFPEKQTTFQFKPLTSLLFTRVYRRDISSLRPRRAKPLGQQLWPSPAHRLCWASTCNVLVNVLPLACVGFIGCHSPFCPSWVLAVEQISKNHQPPEQWRCHCCARPMPIVAPVQGSGVTVLENMPQSSERSGLPSAPCEYRLVNPHRRGLQGRCQSMYPTSPKHRVPRVHRTAPPLHLLQVERR